MASDAHAHPWELRERFSGAAEWPSGIPVAASAWNRAEFEYHEGLAARYGGSFVIPCFGVHPQLCAMGSGGATPLASPEASPEASLETLEALVSEGRVKALGECGFDLYGPEGRAVEVLQEQLFHRHLDIALERDLPLILHVRRAMHKVFALAARLRRVKAVVFHAYAGTAEEGAALLKRGINAWFSFGTAVVLNHQTAMRAAAALPLDRLLTETDAPFQPLRFHPFSTPAGLSVIIQGIARLRREAERDGGTAMETEAAADRNFRAVFGDPA